MLLFLAIPLVALLRHAPDSLGAAIRSADTYQAIVVSLRTTAISLLLTLVCGTPLAILLGRGHFPGRGFVGALVEAPVVLPPAAAGIGLLLAFGRKGLIPTGLPFTAGAVVLAQLFVSAPLFIQPLAAALEGLDPHWQEAAQLDGASSIQTLRWITLPLVRTTIVSGAVMAWARSLGEFGATILFAGNLVGTTQTMPLAIYLGLETDLDQAVGLSVLLMAVAFVVLAAVRGLGRGNGGR
jgi:molybdate transport system permease protein